jgi:hypothetical protein
MCYSELIDELRRRGIDVTESQIRWAIKSGKVSRPPLNKGLNFVFGEEHVEQFIQLFSNKHAARAAGAIND